MSNKALMINIFYQAETYLKEIGEFAPFGAVVNFKDELTTLGYYSEEEIVDSNLAIQLLQKRIREKIIKEKNKAGAIGINVSMRVNGVPQEALMIMFSDNGEKWEESYYIYQLDKDGLVWL